MKRWTLQISHIGQELVEFALILPLLLLLLFGLIEVGVLVLSYNTISNIGREVARYGTVQPEYDMIDQYIDDNIIGSDRRWSIGLNPDELNVERTLKDNGPLVSTIQVTVTYT
ncbi:MAG: TadE/TadG family type IV pilus assembly protein, partial [Anaerolineae bacterium]|nr:TadE/TadG family type IV pilus assembly protein [Anaerolineae bacterium]